VVFVHGTASSVVRWRRCTTRLLADPEIRSRYQFWFFQYDSGNPSWLSSLRLAAMRGRSPGTVDLRARSGSCRRMVDDRSQARGALLVKMQVH